MSIRQTFGSAGLLTVTLGAVIIGCALFVPAGAAAALNVQIIHPNVDPTEVAVGVNVAFEAVAFVDGQELPAGQVGWEWQFGDATHAEVNPTSHAYIAAGDYTATVTATFNQLTATTTTHVVVSDGPETPKRVPFDPALSVYVGFSGLWINCATGQSEFREIEASVALFQPGEQVLDDPDTWASHVVNDAEDPAGWAFYVPDDSEPMQMHVIVRDTQNRLGNVLITNRDNGAEIGTINANTAGSQIDGLVTVPSAANYFLLNIRDKVGGNTLALAATDKPKVDDVIVFTNGYGFDPNRGDNHACPADQYIQGPWGDPDAVGDKVAFQGAGGGGPACAGVTHFGNDNANAGQAAPHYDLLNHRLLKDITGIPDGLSQTAGQKVTDQINAARAPLQNGVTFLPSYITPPFSQGDAHWKVHVNGPITALLCFPYKGKAEWRTTAHAGLETKIDWSLGNGTTNPDAAVVGGISLTRDERNKWRVGDAIAIGSIWGRTADNNQPPLAQPEPITTQITITLHADKTSPNDAPGPIGGTGTLTPVRPFTNPSPPTQLLGTQALTFPATGDHKGVCTVQVAKGFTYRVTTPVQGFYTAGDSGEFNVPNTTEITINVTLTAALDAKVKTVRDGQPVAGHVQVRNAATGTLMAAGDTTLDGEGNYTWHLGPFVGLCQLRAKPIGGPDDAYGEWQDFQTTASTMPQIATLTVPPMPPPPPP